MDNNSKFIKVIDDAPWEPPETVGQNQVDSVSSFEFEVYASTLAGVALNKSNQTPLCVLIQGEWGSGKSTLLKAVSKHIQKDSANTLARHVKPVWFNAWKYKKAESVMAGLLSALLSEIGKGDEDDWMAQLKELVVRHKGRVGKAILLALPAILDKKLTDGTIKEMIEACKSSVDEVLSKCEPIDTFQQAFLEVAAAWLSNEVYRDKSRTKIDDSKHCLAILIDDLDRCDKSQIQDVLETIKLFLAFPGVCFYLAMDQRQLDEYLEKLSPGRSKDALDKFIQVIFNVPRPTPDEFKDYIQGLLINHPLKTTIDELETEGSDDKEREVFVNNLPKNPRAAKRYLNDMALWLHIFEKINQAKFKDKDMQYASRLSAFAGKFHLLSHVAQAENRARWNTQAMSISTCYEWLLSLVNLEPDSTDDNQDHWISNRKSLFAMSKTMMEDKDFAWEALNAIYSFRAREIVAVHNPEILSKPIMNIRNLPWRKIPGKSYEVLSYPVTQHLYFEVMGVNPSKFTAEGNQNHPVEQVSWLDAVKFCNKLSKKLQLEEVYDIDESKDQVMPGKGRKGIRLPLEEEWEHACRAGSSGETYGPLDDIAWYRKNSDGSTHPVGQKKPNDWDLYDMLGNAWEWCDDLYDKEETLRVVRGGGWFIDADYVRTSLRYGYDPVGRGLNIGFRICRDCD